MKRSAALLLLSGLPLYRKSSFLRQLEILASVWKGEGRRVFLCGPVFSEPGAASTGRMEKPEPQWRLEGLGGNCRSFEEVLSRTEAEALLALGYPDQFPFLLGERGIGIPCFLWAQYSRIPRGGLPEAAVYVPLTAKTGDFLRKAGCRRIGPTIPHGVDTRLFQPVGEPDRGRLRRRRGSADSIVVGTVGNNSRRKRFDLIIRSFALLAPLRPESRLMIKTDRLLSLDGVDLTALIARENLENRVETILDELSDRQMAELYNRMDLYLNLSEWEGFCVPVIEAMACGVPVVSLPIQGPGEILPYSDTLAPESLVREEEGSVLYEAKPQAVCRVLLDLADRRELLGRLSRKGRAEAVSRYDIRRVAALWEALF